LDRHGERLPGNVRQRRKPALAKLLPAAILVQVGNDIRLFRVEVCRWIVKCEMPILTYARKCNIDGSFADLGAYPCDDLRWRLRSIEKMVLFDADFIDQALSQILTEAGGILLGHADILVEVKHLYALP